MGRAPLTTAMGRPARPWWRRGGMHVTEIGSIASILAPPLVLLLQYSAASPVVLWAYFIWQAALIYLAIRDMSPVLLFPGIVLPVYVMSASLVFLLPLSRAAMLATVAAAAGLLILRTGVCMSVILHRYAAHAAFRCHEGTNIALAVLGCLANQGGPIWWASHHRCHHKFSDQPRDPHSPLHMGIFAAFSFFDTSKDVIEEFAPPHLESPLLRVIDTFACVPVLVELYIAHALFGAPGLYVSYTSLWLCQALTLWFNIANHPVDGPQENKASDEIGDVVPPNLLFRFVHSFIWVAALIGESSHGHHHDHSTLAHRPGIDLPFHLFVSPLQACGLFWNAKLGDRRLAPKLAAPTTADKRLD